MINDYAAVVLGLVGVFYNLSRSEHLTAVRAAISLATGIGCVFVVPPIATHIIAPPDDIRVFVGAGISLIAGVSGMAIIGAIHASAKAVRDWLPDAIKKYLNRKVGL